MPGPAPRTRSLLRLSAWLRRPLRRFHRPSPSVQVVDDKETTFLSARPSTATRREQPAEDSTQLWWGPPPCGRAAACGWSAGPAVHRERRTSRGPRPEGRGPHGPLSSSARLPPPATVAGPSTSAPGAASEASATSRSAGSPDGGDPGGRRQAGGLALLDLASRETPGSERTSAWMPAGSPARHARDPPPSPGGCTKAAALAHRRTASSSAQVGRPAAARCRAAPPRHSRRRRPAPRRAWPPHRGCAKTHASTRVARGRLWTGTTGQRPAELLGGPGVAEHRSPQPGPRSRTRQPGSRRAPGALRGRGGRAPAAARGTKRRAGVRHRSQASRRVADPGRLHQHRARPHRGAQQVHGLGRQPGRPPPGRVVVVVGVACHATRPAGVRRRAPRPPRWPTRPEEVLRLHAPGVRRRTAAQPVSWARISSTSRAWGDAPAARRNRSSPSSQIATTPRSRTGANRPRACRSRSARPPG